MTWTLNPDRALPAGDLRPLAREIYAATAGLPLVSMHGHVDVAVFAEDRPFPDPAQLLVVPDHYLVRMLVSQGVPIEDMGVPSLDGVRATARAGPPRRPARVCPRCVPTWAVAGKVAAGRLRQSSPPPRARQPAAGKPCPVIVR